MNRRHDEHEWQNRLDLINLDDYRDYSSPHPLTFWFGMKWAILGSAVIVGLIYLGVKVLM